MRFSFRFDRAYRAAALPFGITPATAYVAVAGGELRVRFGPWRLATPLANVGGWETTGGFSFVKTAGPPHLSFADHGVSFATNGSEALCMRFRDPVRVLDPTGLLRHPAATVTVENPDELAEVLRGLT